MMRCLPPFILSLTALSTSWPVGPLWAQATEPFPTGVFVENVPCRSDSSQTYALYLPTSFSGEREWPALLVFDPRGRAFAAAERFQLAAETYGWIILSSNGTRSDGPWEPNRRAMEALWPEVQGRFPVDRRRVYAAGFSGGAVVAWYLAQFGKPSLAGVIACGGRLAAEIPVDSIAFVHFGAAGSIDFNYSEMKRLDTLVSQRGAPHQFRVFPGRHQWLPPELAFESVEWMEILAMQQGRRDRDVQLIENLYAKFLAAAAALEAEGQELTAMRRYAMIAAAWKGLRDVEDVRHAVASLQANSRTRDQEESERRADRFENDNLLRLSNLLGDGDRTSLPDSFDELREELQIPVLQTRAAKGSDIDEAAQRVLEWIFTRTSFYMTRDRMDQGRFDKAKVLLEIALDIHPEASWVWYDLARTQARRDATAPALEALDRAIEHGFRDLSRLEKDPDLASLRGSAGYGSVISRLRELSATAPEPR